MTDQELVKESLRTPNAYAAIVDKYEEPISHYVSRLLYGSKEDVEDVVQEIFITAYRYLNSFNEKYSFSSWLYRIAHNKAIDFLRKNGNKNKNTSIASALEVDTDEESLSAFEQIADDVNTEELVAKELQKETIATAIKKLDPQLRSLIILKYFEEKDYNEISDIMKIPSGTVALYLFRAKNKLKQLLSHE